MTQSRHDMCKKSLGLFNCFIFDIDGVLINTDASYMSAVLRAVKLYGRGAGLPVQNLSESHYRACKRRQGFNNDWDVAEALLLYTVQQKGLSVPLEFEDFLTSLSPCVSTGIDTSRWIAARGKREREAVGKMFQPRRIRSYAMECYAGSGRCAEFYSIKPLLGGISGTMQRETVQVDTRLIEALPGTRGIYTGRNRPELREALRLLGKSCWNGELVF